SRHARSRWLAGEPATNPPPCRYRTTGASSATPFTCTHSQGTPLIISSRRVAQLGSPDSSARRLRYSRIIDFTVWMFWCAICHLPRPNTDCIRRLCQLIENHSCNAHLIGHPCRGWVGLEAGL